MMRGYVHYTLVEFVGGPVSPAVEKFRHVSLILPDVLLLPDFAMRHGRYLHRTAITLLVEIA